MGEGLLYFIMADMPNIPMSHKTTFYMLFVSLNIHSYSSKKFTQPKSRTFPVPSKFNRIPLKDSRKKTCIKKRNLLSYIVKKSQ